MKAKALNAVVLKIEKAQIYFIEAIAGLERVEKVRKKYTYLTQDAKAAEKFYTKQLKKSKNILRKNYAIILKHL
jgi:hypothetical protein